MDLKPTTVLQRVPEINLQVFSNDCARITVMHGQTIESGVYTLPVLDAFSRPCTFEEALQRLQSTSKSVEDWADLTGTIVQLFTAGVLRDPHEAQPMLRSTEKGFDAAPVHIRMLNDRIRTDSYLAAIREVVKPGDVVIDIGTGTGILAVAAAQSGARHVFAIEATAIGTVANAVFEANGVSDRITLVPGWSSQVSLPERADVLVSEIIGNEPLGEQVLETTRDAVKRFLKPEACLIPGKIRIYGIPVEVDESVRSEHVFTSKALTSWRAWYGVDFEPLAHVGRSPHLFFIKPAKAESWRALAEPMLLTEINLKGIQTPSIDAEATAMAEERGLLSGILVYFDLELSSDVTLTTHPRKCDEHCSWVSPVWLLPEPFALQPGDRFRVTYQHRVSGEHSRVRAARMP